MIKNIVFDLGGIFVDLDQGATLRELAKLGFREVTPEIHALFTAYEIGQISTDTFLDNASRMAGITDSASIVASWNSIIVGFPESRLNFLKELAKRNDFNLFLMSNTNALHLSRVEEVLGKEKFREFQSQFSRCYYSHTSGLRKPDAGFFLKILEENGLVPGETLFIDDTAGHIQSAGALSINTWHLIPGKEEITQLNTKLPHVRPGT